MTDVAVTSADERAQLRATVRQFLADRASLHEARRLMETEAGYDPEVWRLLAELGLPGLAIPEEHDGVGLGFAELAIVAEEMGRSLLCAPFFSTAALAAPALVFSGDEEAKREYLPSIAAGSTLATLAVSEDGEDWSLDRIALEAQKSGAAWTLTGHKTLVVDGGVANLLLVLARTGNGLSLFAVEGERGVTRVALPAMDPTRKLARIELASAPARLVGELGGGAASAARALEVASTILAAEQVGGALHCLALTSEYARQRVQFSRRIGSFQAIKHTCANMLVALEPARAAALGAAAALDASAPHRSVAASLAKAVCSETYFQIAKDTIQVHGGVGFTWEHDAHLYFKRAKSSELMLGDAIFHRARMARLLGLAPTEEGVW